MPIFEGAVRARHDNDAEFREVHGYIHQRILDMGFDNPVVGIDFDTVTRPSFANVEAGFMVYAFKDALQATTSIFFRVGFGTGGGTERPRFDWTFGFGYDDFGLIQTSGSLAGVTGSLGLRPSSLSYALQMNASTATPNSHSWSGDGSRLTAAQWYSDSSRDMLVVLERTKDANGNDDARGVMGVFGSSTFHAVHTLYAQSGSSNDRETQMTTVHRPVAGEVTSSTTGELIRQVSVVRIPGTFGIETSHNIIRVESGDISTNQNNSPTIYIPINGEQIPFRVYPVQFGTTAYWVGGQAVRIGLRFQE